MQTQYYSTNFLAPLVPFRDALLKGLAPDKGLYMPTVLPVITPKELMSYAGMPYHAVASSVLTKFIGSEVPAAEIDALCRDAYNFDVPLEKVNDNNYVMRRDRGPTASFKDFAARMMGRLMQYFLRQQNRSMLILTATSGDTGSAVASAFYNLENIKVIVLYPEKEVTDMQRKQMTTLHRNIQIVAVSGKFDDCQHLVKQAFTDTELNHLQLSSANSINIGRLLPQAVYYVYAYSRLIKNIPDEKIVFSVPSGNFGNLMGGLLAFKCGLPVNRFIIATNENDEVPVYFDTDKYELIVPSRNCISSAMNVGHPSNMARIITLYGGVMNEKGDIIKSPDIEQMRRDMFAVSINDEQTRTTIREAYKNHGLILEPHGAVAWAGLMKYQQLHPDAGQISVALETAHPAKFPEEIRDILNIDPQLPESLKGLNTKKEEFNTLPVDYCRFKDYLLSKKW